MKIAIVCYPTFGGSGVVATELGIGLSNRGHEVHFITYKQPVRLEYLSANIHFHEVSVPEYPLFHYQPYELALSTKLVDTIKKYNIDILHVHYAIPHAYAGYMAKQMLKEDGYEIPMMTTLHGTDITLVGSHNFYKGAVNFSINKSDCVTSVSKSLKDDTLRIFDIKNDIHVVPNFIDIDNLNDDVEDCQRHTMADEDEMIITHVSNLRPVKRIDDVVKIFAKVLEHQKAKLIIIGDGPERDKAVNIAIDLGVRDRVIFMGKSNDIEKILCFSDLFLLPSEKESFGLAALEAMAHGVPVISTNTGGLPEVNIQGQSGYLSDVGNIEEMAENALKILQNRETHQSFKDAAKSRANEFDIKNIIKSYEALYESMLVKA
ncbi:N-acetyl-alpha-D-glucosaminyl L-malate synthase BshA [Flavobacteriaceae bacterium 14752]|uniref:N-acetyl-alpha-D-glucosaminyl L-malate synthase BshA n=1 Tax=Mesohalobacter salilacus TaxID=2491711 RepID=UPI000F6377D0|nr:N-acetyl-alpha-D-glucosaminyl L-malate synthase BshA [Flavobacteriaceae bacterium 14752]